MHVSRGWTGSKKSNRAIDELSCEESALSRFVYFKMDELHGYDERGALPEESLDEALQPGEHRKAFIASAIKR